MAAKIIHITDLHVGRKGGAALLRAELDRLPQAAELAPGDRCVLVATGDLVDSPYDPDLESVSRSLRDFQERNSIPVVVLPGNHDMESNRLFHHYLRSPGGWAERKRAFARAFDWTVRSGGSGPLETLLPPMTTVEGTCYRLDRLTDADGNAAYIFGLDSVAQDAFFAGGRLGKAQIERLERDLAGLAPLRPGDRVVVHLHHSPTCSWPGMTLEDSDPLAAALERAGVAVHFLLFGHTHSGKVLDGRPFHRARAVPKVLHQLDGGCLDPDAGGLVHFLSRLVGNHPRKAFRLLRPWPDPTWRDL